MSRSLSRVLSLSQPSITGTVATVPTSTCNSSCWLCCPKLLRAASDTLLPFSLTQPFMSTSGLFIICGVFGIAFATFHFRSLICISDRDFRTETSDCWLVHCLQPLLLRTSEVCFQQLTDYQRPCSPLQSLVLCSPRFTLDCSQKMSFVRWPSRLVLHMTPQLYF